MLTVKNNLIALTAGNQLAANRRKNEKSMEKLSSGYRINRAADDAAGLTISENMRYQIRGLNRAARNVQEGISLIQVADGAMSEISDMIHRMKELGIQAANATNTPEDRANIQQEIDSLLLEIDDIQDKTLFNGIRVLDGGNRIVGGAGGSSGGHYGQGYGIRGGLPSWILNSKGTTPIGHLSEVVRIPYYTFYCTSITDAAGNLISSNTEIEGIGPDPNITDYCYYKAGRDIQISGRYQRTAFHGMNTVGITNGSAGSFTFTGSDQKTYTAHGTYTLHSDDLEAKYAAAFIDFSKVTAANIQELVGNGFSTTCTMCDSRYSIEFVDQGGSGDDHTTFSAPNSSRHHIYTVDISGITGADALIDKIVSVLGNYGSIHNKYNINGQGNYIQSAKPNNHYSDFAAELDNTGKRTGRLIIVSTGDDDRGTFINPAFYPDYGLFHAGIYTYGNNVWIPDPSAPAAKVQGELHIQTGAKKGDAVLIGLPVIHCDTLGLIGLSVITEEDAGDAIDAADYALDILNDERTNLGAWQNRLEHTYANVTHTSENTQAAESRLRDCDMSKEIVANSIQQILLQTGMSVLAQANQRPQMILNMLT